MKTQLNQMLAGMVASLLLGGIVSADPPANRDRGNKPLSPAESKAMFELHPEVEIQLVASEPQVIDPVACAFDDNDRLWVVEMRDYPLGPPEGEVPQSQIRILRDRDGDGRYEHATTFAENLVFPTGVQPWRNGVIATLSGKVMYMADTDGDDVCDLREVWFEGFAEQNTQLRANHPALTIDNRIHISNGLRGGTVSSRSAAWRMNDPKSGEPSAGPVNISGKDFNFDALGGSFAAMPGNGQFGFSEDDFGNVFVCSNRNPCKHVVLPQSVIDADPWLTSADAVNDVVKAGESSRVFSLAPAWTTSNLHSGQFTAACGVHVYDGSGLPATMRGNVFTCEPTGYLVQRQVMKPDGLSFSAKRGRPKVEFLASRDAWFRPVNLNSGPDGALYVVDMYRAVIEHPQFVPTELKQRPDQQWGKQHGRIWRVVTKTEKAAAKKPLDKRKVVQRERSSALKALVSSDDFDESNRWHRRALQRLCVEELEVHRPDVIQDLKNYETKAKESPPEMRSRTIHLARLLNIEVNAIAMDVLQHEPDARARAQAVKLIDPSKPSAADAFELACKDSSALVAAPAWSAFARSGLSAVVDLEFPKTLLQHAISDRFVRAYLMAPAVKRQAGRKCFQVEMLANLLNDPLDDARLPLAEELARRVGLYGSSDDIANVFKRLGLGAPSIRVALAINEGIARSKRSSKELLADLRLSSRVYARLREFASKQAFGDSQVTSAQRIAAIRWLQTEEPASLPEKLAKLFASDAPSELRISAIETLGSLGDQTVPEKILSSINNCPPAMRRACVNVLLRRSNWTSNLLDAIEAKDLAPSVLDVSQSNRLRRHSDKQIASRASKLFASLTASRQAVIDRYEKEMPEAGNSQLGKAIFSKQCASCHVVGGIGHVVGPDISDSRTKTPAQLLVSILNPGAAIDANYFRYTVVTLDGRTVDGLLVDETPAAVTLKRAEGKLETLSRDDIDFAKSSSLSLMPEGFEQQISPAQMRDLISYIKNWRYLDGAVPGLEGSQ